MYQEIQKDYQFIETQDQLLKAVPDYDDVDTIVVDIETTSLSARTGVVIGIAISSREHQGHFISLEVVNNNYDYFFDLFANKRCVFHLQNLICSFSKTLLGFCL